jgi:predicted amidophosphoribosyltransferase
MFTFLRQFLCHLFWPVTCPLCGRMAVPVCPACLDALLLPPTPVCLRCGVSAPCSAHPDLPPLFFGTLHDGMPRRLLLDLKYRGQASLGIPMGHALGRLVAACPDFPEGDLVPVPLHRGSPRSFNQARLLAEGMASVLSRPVRDVLEWQRSLPPQAERSAADRRNLSEEALAVRRCSGSLRGVILVDDVCTTGTTFLRAAGAVMRAGGTVSALVSWSRSRGGNPHGSL